jgi:hypothetical protein
MSKRRKAFQWSLIGRFCIKSRKVSVGFVLCFVPFARPAYQRFVHWRIRETVCWALVWKSVEKILICVNSDNNIRHFTGRPKHTCVVNNNTKCFVARQGYKGNPLLYFDGRTQAVFNCWQLFVGQKQNKIMALLLLHSIEHAKIYLIRNCLFC